MALASHMRSASAENIILFLGLAICYAFGTAWFVFVMSSRGNSYSFIQALMICVVPYIVPDICKLILSHLVAVRVSRALTRSETA